MIALFCSIRTVRFLPSLLILYKGATHNYVFLTLPTTSGKPLKAGSTYTLPINSFNFKMAPVGSILPQMLFTNTDSTFAITINTLNSAYISGTYSGNLLDATNDTAYITGKFKHHF